MKYKEGPEGATERRGKHSKEREQNIHKGSEWNTHVEPKECYWEGGGQVGRASPHQDLLGKNADFVD